MPTIGTFYGILIQTFRQDHAPPHVHALSVEHEGRVAIRSLGILQGGLPSRAMALLLEGAKDHCSEPMEDRDLCALKRPPKKNAPLR